MNKKLKAAHSHFIAERDKIIAELDGLLNGQTNSDCLGKIFELFREMAIVNVAISNIESIVADNEQSPSQNLEFSNNHLEEINKMAEAIREKMSDVKNDLDDKRE